MSVGPRPPRYLVVNGYTVRAGTDDTRTHKYVNNSITVPKCILNYCLDKIKVGLISIFNFENKI